MILASRQPNGKVHYFNAFTGVSYKPGRETGRYLGHIPDDVIRFLFPKIESKKPDISPDLQRRMTNIKEKTAFLLEKPSIWSLLIAWFKSLFSNGKRK